MTTANKTKYYSLPVLSKEARRNSNLATNLATVGLFSALAACGGSSSSGGGSSTPTPAVAFGDFTENSSLPTGITYGSANASGASFTIQENVKDDASDITLGTVAVSGTGSFTYSISDFDGYGDYFAIDQSSGEIKLKMGKSFNFEAFDAADRQVNLKVVATDADGGTGTYAVALEVTNVTESFALDTFDETTSHADGTRYAGGDADTTTLYIREGLDSGSVLDLGTVKVQSDGEVTYSIDSAANFSFDSGAITGTVADYISIDNDGKLKLIAPFVFGTNADDATDDKNFSFDVTVSSSGRTDLTHAITVKLGDYVEGEARGYYSRLSAGDDYLYGGTGADLYSGREGNDIMYGNAGNDGLQGHAGNDFLYGGVGNDSLEAGVGDDTLYGGAGIDSLEGGLDSDIMYGGDNKDTFLFYKSINSGVDIIKDFKRSDEDQIKIVRATAGLTFASLTKIYSDGSAIVTGHDAGGTLTIESYDGNIWSDTNPLLATDFEITYA